MTGHEAGRPRHRTGPPIRTAPPEPGAPASLPAPQIIRDHVWRPPPRLNATPQGTGCAYMSCRRPQTDHAPRVYAVPAPVLITAHVWRPPAVQRTNVALPPLVDRPCEYMNCQLPRAAHTRSIALDGRRITGPALRVAA